MTYWLVVATLNDVLLHTLLTNRATPYRYYTSTYRARLFVIKIIIEITIEKCLDL